MQIEGIKTSPKTRDGKLAGIYSDSSTGTTFDRIEINKMLKAIESKKNDVSKIYIWSWDRFGRNLEFALKTVRFIHECNVEIESIDNSLLEISVLHHNCTFLNSSVLFTLI